MTKTTPWQSTRPNRPLLPPTLARIALGGGCYWCLEAAVYVLDADRRREAEAILLRLQAEFDAPLVTRVLPLAAFRPAEPRYRHYFYA